MLLLLLAPFSYAGASGAVSQSYQTSTEDIAPGALLSIKSTDTTEVELASSATNATKLVGVAAEKPLISLSEGVEGTVQTVIGGTAQVLVSDLNGDVSAGDKIAVSPVSGIGMKAVASGEIVGTAQADLGSASTVRKTVAGQNGKTLTIKVGLLPVAINVGYYAAAASTEGAASFVPPFLQNLANGIAGKEVSPMRVLLSTLTLLLGFIAAMTILYAAVRNSVISLGRNPLAEGTLRKELINVIITSIGVLALTAAVVYIILLG